MKRYKKKQQEFNMYSLEKREERIDIFETFKYMKGRKKVQDGSIFGMKPGSTWGQEFNHMTSSSLHPFLTRRYFVIQHSAALTIKLVAHTTQYPDSFCAIFPLHIDILFLLLDYHWVFHSFLTETKKNIFLNYIFNSFYF